MKPQVKRMRVPQRARPRAMPRVRAGLLAAGLALPMIPAAPAWAQFFPPSTPPAGPSGTGLPGLPGLPGFAAPPADRNPATGATGSTGTTGGGAGAMSAVRSPELRGRTVEGVEVRGNREVSTAVIRNQIRTRVGEPLDPQTVIEDYQRIYSLRRFRNVEARAEPTAAGVIVVFVVTEERTINSIRFNGNRSVEDAELRAAVEVRPGEAVDSFRVALSRQAIENLYRGRNFPLVQVGVDQQALADRGDVVFNITEGPNARVRKVDFKSAAPLSFTKDDLRDEVKTSSWVFIFNPGRYDPQQVEEDVAALRKFYENNGFFDARVGRRIVWSPDLSEIQVDFLIDEGPRYVVDRVTFQGNTSLADKDLRRVLRLTEGRVYNNDLLQRDIRQMVREYGNRFGFIYQPQSTDPDYMRIEAKPKFLAEPGRVELVYTVREGKEFRLGNVLVKGNYKSQDKLVYREFRDLVPGSRFNAGELQDAERRLQGLGHFSSVTLTPIGDEPGVRDVLVEVTEARTASFNIGAGITSNGGILGNVTYQQRNFDIANLPSDFTDVFTDRAFTGAGQHFRATLAPGTRQTTAVLQFSEPYLFDQPYGFSNELYLRTIVREDYDDRRIGDTVTLSQRFDYVHTAFLTVRGEAVRISDVEDEAFRAPEILAEEGSNTLTSVALAFRRDTTNPGVFQEQGSITLARAEAYGALGGDYSFQKFTLEHDSYFTVAEDLLDRKTVLSFHGNAGVITGDSVFFERFYGGGGRGGLGGIRGFQFRGISPRSGRAEDRVGGDFLLAGSVELNFPVVGQTLRGVVFTDAGTVERDIELGTLRTSVGAGVRIALPFLGQAPLAVDFAVPITRDDEDDEQFISFSFGFIQ